MRMKMVFALKQPRLSVEYRRSFLSLLKRAFQQASSEVYAAFYENGTPMKPFTFSLYLPGAQFRDQTIVLPQPQVSLFFSTVRTDLGIYFYNSLLQTRFAPFPLPHDNGLTLKSVALVRERAIPSGEGVFKTLSPFLVRLHHPETNSDDYLLPGDERFLPQFDTITGAQFKELTGREETVQLEPVQLNKIPVRHYNCLLESNKGIIKLSGSPAALEFLYRAGIGSRRSEGFGMLEVLH